MNEETIIDESQETAPEEEVIEQPEQEPETPEQPKEETEQEKYSKRVQKRIDKLEWEKNEERRRVYALEQELEKARSHLQPQQRTAKEGAPNPDTFVAGRYDPDYLEALTDYKTQLAIDKLKESARIEKVQANVATMQQAAKEQYGDYEDVTEEFLAHPIANVKEFNDLLMDTDNPVELAYYLGKNPNELDKLGNMTIAQATRYIGRIEAQIEQSTKPLEPTKKPVSNAPKPVSPVGSAKPTAATKDWNDMDMNEFVAMRNSKR